MFEIFLIFSDFYRIEKLEAQLTGESRSIGTEDLGQKEEIIKCLQTELVKVRHLV